MSIASHLQELRRKHENLSHMVESEQRSPGSDALKIAELKKQKLKLKEETVVSIGCCRFYALHDGTRLPTASVVF